MARKTKRIAIQALMQGILLIRSLFLIPHGVCRYTPSCTAYAQDALTHLPFPRAVFEIVKRLLRCNPFAKGGYDPAPVGKQRTQECV